MTSRLVSIASAALLIVACLPACGADEDKEKEAKEAKEAVKQLRGAWAMTQEATGGSGGFDPSGKPGLTVEDGRLVLRARKKEVTYGYELKPSASPKEIDLTGPDLRPRRGIYKVAGDELTLCLGSLGGERPGTFDPKSHALTAWTLYTFKRVKPPDEAAVKEMKKLAGTWQAVHAEEGGRPFTDVTVKALKYTIFADGKIVVRWGAEATFIYELDVKAKPRAIDLVQMLGADKPGAKCKGIYKLDGDELTICLDEDMAARPAEFESKPKTKMVLYKFKREKQ